MTEREDTGSFADDEAQDVTLPATDDVVGKIRAHAARLRENGRPGASPDGRDGLQVWRPGDDGDAGDDEDDITAPIERLSTLGVPLPTGATAADDADAPAATGAEPATYGVDVTDPPGTVVSTSSLPDHNDDDDSKGWPNRIVADSGDAAVAEVGEITGEVEVVRSAPVAGLADTLTDAEVEAEAVPARVALADELEAGELDDDECVVDLRDDLPDVGRPTGPVPGFDPPAPDKPAVAATADGSVSLIAGLAAPSTSASFWESGQMGAPADAPVTAHIKSKARIPLAVWIALAILVVVVASVGIALALTGGGELVPVPAAS